MRYVNNYDDEVYDDRESCRDNLIFLQEEGKSDLMNVLEWSIDNRGEGDREYAAMLNAGYHFIRECVQFVEDLLESSGTDFDDRFIDPYIKEYPYDGTNDEEESE